MSASMNMVIDIFKGGEAAANAIAEALYKAEGKRNKSILVSDSRIEVSNSQFYEIWGEDYLSPTSSLYEGFAKAAPEAEWHAHSYRIFEGGGEGCEAMDDAYYKEHVLKYAVEGSFDSLSFDGLSELILDPWGDVENNISDLRDRDKEFFLDGRLKSQIGLNKLITDFIEENGGEVLDEMPEDAEDDVFVISDKKRSDAVKNARELGIPVLTGADFIALFIGYDEFEELAEEADKEFDSSTFSDEYGERLTFDAVKLVFDVSDGLTEEKFEELRERKIDAEFELSGDFLDLIGFCESDYVSIEI